MADRFEMTYPAQDDLYNIALYNENVRKIAENALKSANVSTLQVMDKVTYDALETKNETVLYLVKRQSDFLLYLGSTPMQTGGAAVPATAATAMAVMLTGRMVMGTAATTETEV